MTEAEAMTAAEFLSTLNYFLDRIAPAARFLRDVRASGGRADLFVGWFFAIFSALSLDQLLLAKLGDLEIDLNLDIYVGEPTGD